MRSTAALLRPTKNKIVGTVASAKKTAAFATATVATNNAAALKKAKGGKKLKSLKKKEGEQHHQGGDTTTSSTTTTNTNITAATATAVAIDPRASILLSSYRTCLKELDRAMRLHQGNTSNIVKAVFGPTMDVETLRRAALMATTIPTSTTSNSAASVASVEGSSSTSDSSSGVGDGVKVSASLLFQPPHAFDESLRPRNIRLTLPGALRMFVEGGHEAENKGRTPAPTAGTRSPKTTATESTLNASSSSQQRFIPLFDHPDGAALAAILRLFFQPISSETHPLFGCIPAASSSPATSAAQVDAHANKKGHSGIHISAVSKSKKQQNATGSSQKKSGSGSGGEVTSEDESRREAIISQIMNDPQFQMMALSRCFEFVKKLREATRGFPYPSSPTKPPTATEEEGSQQSKQEVAAQTTKTTTSASSAVATTAGSAAVDENNNSAPSPLVIDLAPGEDSQSNFVSQCIQIVTQRIQGGPPGATAMPTTSRPGNSFDDPIPDESATDLLASGDRHRSLFSRVAFPHAGTGDIASIKHLCVPNDPFHVNNLSDDSAALFAPELAVIEALAAMANATRGEIPESVVKTPKEETLETQKDTTEQQQKGKITGEKKDSAFSSLPHIYNHTTAYVRTTPGALISPVRTMRDATTKSMLAPTTDNIPLGLELVASPDTKKEESSIQITTAAQKRKAKSSEGLTADDIIEPEGSLEALNSEFGGVRAPFFFSAKSAPTARSSSSSPFFPIISSPRPIETAHGASLLTFKELPYMRLEQPWYQCASPDLYTRELPAIRIPSEGDQTAIRHSQGRRRGAAFASLVGMNTALSPSATANKKKVKGGAVVSSSSPLFAPDATRSLLPKAIRDLRGKLSATPCDAKKIAAATAPTGTAAVDILKQTATSVVRQIPTKTTTITNGVIAVTIATTYAGKRDAATTTPSNSNSLHRPDAPHVFQYRVTIRNISGGVEEKLSNPNGRSSEEEVGSITSGPSGTGSYLGANTNSRAVKVTVVSRHWAFIDAANQTVKEVVGPGVVGNSPRLLPGEHFTYESGTAMASEEGGYMRGSLQCVAILDDEDNAIMEALEAKRVLAEYEVKRLVEEQRQLEALAAHQQRLQQVGLSGEPEVGGVLSSSQPPAISSRHRLSRAALSALSSPSEPTKPTERAVMAEAQRLLDKSFRSTQSCFDVAISATALRKE